MCFRRPMATKPSPPKLSRLNAFKKPGKPSVMCCRRAMATKPSPPKLSRLNAFKKPDSDSADSDCEDSDSTSQTAPEAPQRYEAPSSSSADSKKSVIKNINEDIAAIEIKNEDVYLEKVMEHLNKLLQLIEEENHEKPSTVSKWTWPKSSGLKKLKDYLQLGIDGSSALKDIISGPVKKILKEIGHASLATAVLLVVAYSLERYEDFSSNKEECLKVLKEMCYVANLVKSNRKGLQNELEEATALIVEGSIICCAQIGSSSWKRFLIASENKDELSNVTKRLHRLYRKINLQNGFRVLTAIESMKQESKRQESYLRRGYPTHAVGFDENVTKYCPRPGISFRCPSDVSSRCSSDICFFQSSLSKPSSSSS